MKSRRAKLAECSLSTSHSAIAGTPKGETRNARTRNTIPPTVCPPMNRMIESSVSTMQPSSHTADATQNRNVTIAASRDNATITGTARILRTIIAATSIKKSGWFVLLPILYRWENRHTRMSSFHDLETFCPEVVKAGERHKAAPRQIIGSPQPTAFSAARTAAPKGRHSPFGATRSPRDRYHRCWHGRPLGLGCWHTAAARPPTSGCPRGQHGEHSR